jgi:hypothetical protein
LLIGFIGLRFWGDSMINIDIFSLGNEFKSDCGEMFKVISNFSEGKKIFIELEKAEPVEPPEELIKE